MLLLDFTSTDRQHTQHFQEKSVKALGQSLLLLSTGVPFWKSGFCSSTAQQPQMTDPSWPPGCSSSALIPSQQQPPGQSSFLSPGWCLRHCAQHPQQLYLNCITRWYVVKLKRVLAQEFTQLFKRKSWWKVNETQLKRGLENKLARSASVEVEGK